MPGTIIIFDKIPWCLVVVCYRRKVRACILHTGGGGPQDVPLVRQLLFFIPKISDYQNEKNSWVAKL